MATLPSVAPVNSSPPPSALACSAVTAACGPPSNTFHSRLGFSPTVACTGAKVPPGGICSEGRQSSERFVPTMVASCLTVRAWAPVPQLHALAPSCQIVEFAMRA
eukprot:scaffold135108_cov18-Tisochrysis_lutea.AAC.1